MGKYGASKGWRNSCGRGSSWVLTPTQHPQALCLVYFCWVVIGGAGVESEPCPFILALMFNKIIGFVELSTAKTNQ